MYAYILYIAEGGALRSLSEMGAMLTMFTTGIKSRGGVNGAANGDVKRGGGDHQAGSAGKKEDNLVMDTKLKIIDILAFILNVRLDYRITCLLSIFKREFDESGKADSNR